MTSEEKGTDIINLVRLAQYFIASHETSGECMTVEKLCSVVLETITSQGIDVNHIISEIYCGLRFKLSGCYLLHFAVEIASLKLVKILLSVGAHFTVKNTRGDTPLHLAIKYNDYTELEEYLEDYRLCRKLIWYIKGRLQNYRIAELILDEHIQTENTVNPSCKSGVSHLHIACAVNHSKSVEFFLKSGIAINQAVNNDSEFIPGYTPLHVSARYSSFETMKILLDYGADINLKNADDLTPLKILLKRNIEINDVIKMGKRGPCSKLLMEKKINKSMIRLLLKYTKEIKDEGLSLLHVTCTLRNKHEIQDCFQKSNNINATIDRNSKFYPGYSPLHFAACSDISTVSLLIQSGADLLIKDANGITPLDLCMQRYQPIEIYSNLSKYKEYSNILLSNGTTKLWDLILSMESCEIFEAFISSLEDVNIIVPNDSCLWAGYNLLHLVVDSVQKSQSLKIFYNDTNYSYTKISEFEYYNCTKEEQKSYCKKIEICLNYGVNMNTKNAAGLTPLHQAFRKSKEKAVLTMLDNMPEKIIHNPADPGNLSHFHIACIQDNFELVEKFLRAGVDPNSKIDSNINWKDCLCSGSTALHIAVLNYSTDIVKLLINNKADPHIENCCNLTPVHYFMSHPIDEDRLMGTLIMSGIEREIKKNKFNLSYAHIAQLINDKSIWKALMKSGTDMNAKIKFEATLDCPEYSFLSNFNGCTPLHIAQKNNNYEGMDFLINNCAADIHSQDAEGKSILHYILENESELSESMIRKLELNDNGEINLLHVACMKCNSMLVKRQLQKRRDINCQFRMDNANKDWAGYTPMHFLMKSLEYKLEIKNDFTLTLDALLEHDADMNLKDIENSTPIHLAFELYNDGKIHLKPILLKLLTIYNNYSMNPTNTRGVSYFHICCAIGDITSVKAFLNHNIDVNETTNLFATYFCYKGCYAGFSPLHFAIDQNHKEIARLLINYGADIKIEDLNGNTPIHIAAQSDSPDFEFFEFLLSNGADIEAINLWGQTPIELLIKSDNSTVAHIEFFLKNGSSITETNSVSLESIIGIAFKNFRVDQIGNLKTIFTSILEQTDDQSIIHKIVSVYDNIQLKSDNYIDIIEWILKFGFDLEYQDRKGKTALHIAVDYKNEEAIKALLIVGADVNKLNKSEQTPFSYCLEFYKTIRGVERGIIETFMSHIRKMKFVNLEICTKNETSFNNTCDTYRMDEDKVLELIIEMESLRETMFDNLFNENLLIPEYPLMSFSKRCVIDGFFKSSYKVHQMFPGFGSLLMLQYRKIQARLKLLPIARDAMVSLGIELPNLCLEKIFRYLNNSDLLSLIKSVPEYTDVNS